jgi:putative cardiolipin synthase
MLSGVDALAARITLTELAQRSLDVQYYIWDPDDSGRLLAQRLMAAADRGVRVRALLDDFGEVENDSRLLALDSHPNIEVRLFNPIVLRDNLMLGMLMDFNRTTRRMHNKSFNADNQVAIIGGRNIGDGYFEGGAGYDMADVDAIAIGPVVQQVSESFDLYWNCSAAFPIASLTTRPLPENALRQGLERLNAHAETMKQSPSGQRYFASPLIEQLRGGSVEFFWGQARLMYDHPDKVAELSNDPKVRLLPRVREVTGDLQQQLLIVSPYFVPGHAGVEFFRSLREKGIRVIILTNSMASTDAFAAYAGYSRYRQRLLDLGVELYEFKPTAAYRRGQQAAEGAPHTLGSSSRASLHAKTFTFDRRKIFIGSLNLDPRSAHLNTEVGVVFDCPELAREFSERLEGRLLEIAWRVEAVPDRFLGFKTTKLNWITQDGQATTRLTEEPGQSFWRNFTAGLIRALPVESQL